MNEPPRSPAGSKRDESLLLGNRRSGDRHGGLSESTGSRPGSTKMTKPSIDALAIAMDWLDAYSGVSIDRLLSMFSPDAVIECACGDYNRVSGSDRIFDYLLHQTVQYPSIGLHDIRMDGDIVALTFRTTSGLIWAFLEIAENGLIASCRCGFIEHAASPDCCAPTYH